VRTQDWNGRKITVRPIRPEDEPQHRRFLEMLDPEDIRMRIFQTRRELPDFLALVGDSADGYPGISGIGKTGAAQLLNQYGPIEAFPDKVLGKKREQALLFKHLATLRTDALLFDDVDELRWRGPTPAFAELAAKMDDPRLLKRANDVAAKVILPR
jgi:5'-3' exonuclease